MTAKSEARRRVGEEERAKLRSATRPATARLTDQPAFTAQYTSPYARGRSGGGTRSAMAAFIAGR